MLLSKKVMVRWNGSTRKWYEERGYIHTKQNEYFECEIDDVMTTSPIKVEVQCDYCGKPFMKPYRNLFKERSLVNKDCCKNRSCMCSKSEEVNMIKYGCKNHMQTQESKDHLSEYSRTPWSEVVNAFENKNLKLISDESDYRNDRSRLNFICNNHEQGGIQETNYQNVKYQKHCCKYGGIDAVAEAKRLDGQIVYDEFIRCGLIPQFSPSDYSKNDEDLPYICSKHMDKGVQYRRYSNLKYAKGCVFCARESTANALRLEQDFVFDYFKSRELNVLDKQYFGKDEHIRYECNKHKGIEQSVTYNGLKRTKCPCRFCREENNLHKLSRTIRSSLTWWRKYSRNIFNNKCLLTGIKGNVEVHHQYQLDNIIKDVLSELGIELKDKYTGEEIVLIKDTVSEYHKRLPVGICLNKDIHILFHIEYGKRNCTKSVFDEFMTRYFNGELDYKLESKLKSNNSKMNLEEAKKLASFYYAQN